MSSRKCRPSMPWVALRINPMASSWLFAGMEMRIKCWSIAGICSKGSFGSRSSPSPAILTTRIPPGRTGNSLTCVTASTSKPKISCNLFKAVPSSEWSLNIFASSPIRTMPEESAGYMGTAPRSTCPRSLEMSPSLSASRISSCLCGFSNANFSSANLPSDRAFSIPP